MSSPDFEAIKHLNPYNVEYWEARELQPLLGYKSWREFEGAIERAKTSCEATGNIVDDHFVSGYKLIEAGKGAKRPITDYTLSRLACYLIAMNGNPRLPQIAEAQQYFAVSTRKNEMHELRQAHQERIQIRLEVAEGNKQLSEAAAEAGVRSQMFGIFHDAGYLGQYTLDSENIRIYKEIPEGGEILDYMGREELASIMRDKLRKVNPPAKQPRPFVGIPTVLPAGLCSGSWCQVCEPPFLAMRD